MNINPLSPSQITEARPSASTAVAEPPKPAPKAAPAAKPVSPAAKQPETKKPDVPANGKVEVTDVKPTGELTPEGEPTFTLKVNGKEIKATQTEIIALAQKARGAEVAMKKLAELEKESANLLENFDKDVWALMVQRHGKEKAKELAVAMVKNLIAEESKDPKDLELEELRASKKAAEDEKKRLEEERKQTELKAKRQVLYRQMLEEIDRELNDTHLPKDRLTLTRVLNYLAAGKKANGQSWTVRDAVKAVEVEDMGHATYYAKRYVEGKLPSDKFRAIFGEDALKKLNKEQINVLKNADKIAKNEQTKQESGANGTAPVTERRPRTLSKNKGSEGISEREYRRQYGSLGGI